MKILKLLILFMIVPAIHYAQICSANPGGDQTICTTDQMMLYGEDSDFYQHPLDVSWSVVSSVSPVTINNSTSLQSSVSSNSPSGLFETGVYVFELTVICIDGESTSSQVTITVGEILNPATILSPSDNRIETCNTQIEFTGSAPDPGVTATWSITPNIGITRIPTPNGGVMLSHNSSSVCDYTLTYFQSAGTCTSFDEVDISFTRSHSNVIIDYIDPAGCPTCTKEIYIRGTHPGCNGTPVWSVSPSTGVDISNPNNQYTTIKFDQVGVYDITYTIENGDCPTASITSTCQINDLPGFEIGQNEYYVSCSDSWDIESLDLFVNDMPGVEYEWTVSSNYGTGWINIQDPTASSTTVDFSGTPIDLTSNGIRVQFNIEASYNDCTDTKSIYFYSNPTVNVSTKDVYLLCGGDPYFKLSDYVVTSGGAYFNPVEVLDAPDISNLPPGAFFPGLHVDLTVCGNYSFLISVQRTGIDHATGVSVTCTDEEVINVVVANIPTINAGSDIITCLTSTELNGNIPFDPECGELDIPVFWELLSGQSGVDIQTETEENPCISGLMPGETYIFEYSFSKEPGCMIKDEMTVTVLPETQCDYCEIEVDIIGECTEGCLQLSVTGDAAKYIWSPSTGLDLTNPLMPVICETSGGFYTVIGFNADDVACGSFVIEIPECTDICEPLEGDAILVYAGCAPDLGPNTVEYDIILPDFPVVPISEITVTGGGQVYYDVLDRLHYNGNLIACGEICFTIFIDEDCSQSHCIDLPTCLGPPCNDILYSPNGYCNSIEGNFGLGVNVFYFSDNGNPATEIHSVNELNQFELDQNTFSLQNYPDAQMSALEFWGSTVNENGVIPLLIQVLGPFGQILCEDRKQFNPDYFCDDQDLINYVFNTGAFPGGGRGEGRDNKQKIVKESDENLFNIYPIPASEYVHIEHQFTAQFKVELIDVSGKVISSFNANESEQLTVPMDHLSPGIYLFRFTNSAGDLIGKELVPVIR